MFHNTRQSSQDAVGDQRKGSHKGNLKPLFVNVYILQIKKQFSHSTWLMFLFKENYEHWLEFLMTQLLTMYLEGQLSLVQLNKPQNRV